MSVSMQTRVQILCGVCLDNVGRYVVGYQPQSEANKAGLVPGVTHLVCGTCTVKHKFDAIKLDDVPALLAWCREVLAGGTMGGSGGSSFEALRTIIGVKP